MLSNMVRRACRRCFKDFYTFDRKYAQLCEPCRKRALADINAARELHLAERGERQRVLDEEIPF